MFPWSDFHRNLSMRRIKIGLPTEYDSSPSVYRTLNGCEPHGHSAFVATLLLKRLRAKLISSKVCHYAKRSKEDSQTSEVHFGKFAHYSSDPQVLLVLWANLLAGYCLTTERSNAIKYSKSRTVVPLTAACNL